MIKVYFRLNPECYFIRGIKCGAIFDLIETKIYSLNQQETKIVTSCEKNYPVMPDNEKFLDGLKQLRLGNFYRNRTYIQKLRLGSPSKESEMDPPLLYRAFLEINNSCNRNCWFCGFYGIKRSLGCMGCNKWQNNGRSLSMERWKKVIDELKYLDCRDIFITGGDLTLVWDSVKEILNYTESKFSNIYIILHQQSLSSDKIIDLADKANIIVQIEEFKNIELYNSAILSIVKPENWRDICGIESKNIMNDFIIEDGNSFSSTMPIISKRKISAASMFNFLNNIEYHPCLGHTLTICNNGDVIPCPMMRGHIFGNIRNRALYTVFERSWDKISKFWKLNLDKIEKCTACEFRYTCADCRALEESLTGKLEGKMLCSYNPNEGVWL